MTRTVLFAIVCYVLFVVAAAPASVAAWAFARSTDGTLNLEGAYGSAWNGRARAVWLSSSQGMIRLERFNWEWRPARLGLGEIAVALHIDDPDMSGTGRVAFRRDGIQVSDIVLRMRAAFVSMHVPALAASGLSGNLSIETNEFTFGSERYDGAATIDWQDAACSYSRVRPLGDYRAVVTGMGQSVDIHLHTLKGVLRLEGRGIWSPGRTPMAFQGTARGPEVSRPELEDLLRLLGPHRGQGVHEVVF